MGMAGPSTLANWHGLPIAAHIRSQTVSQSMGRFIFWQAHTPMAPIRRHQPPMSLPLQPALFAYFCHRCEVPLRIRSVPQRSPPASPRQVLPTLATPATRHVRNHACICQRGSPFCSPLCCVSMTLTGQAQGCLPSPQATDTEHVSRDAAAWGHSACFPTCYRYLCYPPRSLWPPQMFYTVTYSATFRVGHITSKLRSASARWGPCRRGTARLVFRIVKREVSFQQPSAQTHAPHQLQGGGILDTF